MAELVGQSVGAEHLFCVNVTGSNPVFPPLFITTMYLVPYELAVLLCLLAIHIGEELMLTGRTE